MLLNNNANIHTYSTRVLRGALKLRYLVLGGAITGGVTMNKVSVAVMVDGAGAINCVVFVEIRRMEGRIAGYEMDRRHFSR